MWTRGVSSGVCQAGGRQAGHGNDATAARVSVATATGIQPAAGGDRPIVGVWMEKASGRGNGSGLHFLRSAADHVDRCMSGHEHSSAMSRWATILSRALGHDASTTWRLEIASRLHDVGKIVVPESILSKSSGLTSAEWDLLRQHPDHGARLARLVPGLGAVADSIRQHHERYDGTGYPDRLRGNEIRVESRVIAVCDSWAAMRSDRAYQAALPEDRAREQLHNGRGSQFDPELVDLFLDLHHRGQVGTLELLSEPAAA